jgi:hypothetical protein
MRLWIYVIDQRSANGRGRHHRLSGTSQGSYGHTSGATGSVVLQVIYALIIIRGDVLIDGHHREIWLWRKILWYFLHRTTSYCRIPSLGGRQSTTKPAAGDERVGKVAEATGGSGCRRRADSARFTAPPGSGGVESSTGERALGCSLSSWGL